MVSPLSTNCPPCPEIIHTYNNNKKRFAPLKMFHFLEPQPEQQLRRRLQKSHLKSEFVLLQTLSRLFHFVQFDKFWRIFLEIKTPFTRTKKIDTARQIFGTVLTILRHGTPNFRRVNVSVPNVIWHQCSKF